MDNTKKSRTIKNRQSKQKEALLEQLRKYPIIQVACEKSGTGRQTYYRWRTEDKEFEEASDKAISEGEDFFNDLGEHQLLSLMKDKHWPAIRFWLEKRHPKFNKTKIETDRPIEIAFMYKQQH
jgi:hypothetical protein